ncbi:hypothetical protein MXB_1288, partial [Myxobolus squamalis]
MIFISFFFAYCITSVCSQRTNNRTEDYVTSFHELISNVIKIYETDSKIFANWSTHLYDEASSALVVLPKLRENLLTYILRHPKKKMENDFDFLGRTIYFTHSELIKLIVDGNPLMNIGIIRILNFRPMLKGIKSFYKKVFPEIALLLAWDTIDHPIS